LDLGGGNGELQLPLEDRGYAYINLDLEPRGQWSVVGDAHRTPFQDKAFSLIVSKDSLEHFLDFRAALQEARRVIEPNGRFVIWVPFLHPFHATDYFRYTPLGLETLLNEAGFLITSLESPLWIASVVAQACVEIAKRLGFGSIEVPLERVAAWLDRRLSRLKSEPASFAAAYLVVAEPK
jgi:SAM-dependent methyltransferase